MTRSHRVVALAYDGLCTFEFAIAVEVFALPRPEIEGPWYDFTVAGLEAGPLKAAGGLAVVAPRGLEALTGADTIVVPGWRGIDVAVPERLVRALRRAHDRGARLVSICSGVFVLAAAGLLDRRPATTHWRYVDALRTRHPTVKVVADRLYVDDGEILTSAGSAAGLDLCLHVVRRDHGPDIANTVARRLVLPTHREGGQAQFIPKPVAPPGPGIGPLLDRLRGLLDQPLRTADIARRAGLSERTLQRRFREATGLSPHAWLTAERIALGRELLEATDLSIPRIAERTGLTTPETFRHHFRRLVGVSPTRYRAAFRT